MRKVEVATAIRTTPSTAIAAFMNPEMLRGWWGVERALIDPKPGGPYTLAWNISEKGFGYISTGRIKAYDPARELIVDNFVYLNPEKPFLGPMTLTVRAREKGPVTELYLCQDGYREGTDWDWYYEAVKQAWPVVVQTLKDYLEKPGTRSQNTLP